AARGDMDTKASNLVEERVVVADAKHHHILVAHEWRAPFDRRERAGSARNYGQVFTGGSSDELAVSEVTKVAVPVDERQPEATTPTQRELVSDQDTAVAAEKDGEEDAVEKALQGVGKIGGE